MTVDEMREKIKEHCDYKDFEYCIDECPLKGKSICFSGSEEKVKENYEILFGKQSVQFTLSDIKSGYLCKLRNGYICVVNMISNTEWGLFNSKNECITTDFDLNRNMTDAEDDTNYDIMEVYGYSSRNLLFDTNSRTLLYKREEVKVDDINTKMYNISNIEISPNYDTGYNNHGLQPIFIKIHNDDFTSISIEDTKELIKSLQEIVDYVEKL